MTSRILIGDVREQLATLPDASVQCCVTSPPYYGLNPPYYGIIAAWEITTDDSKRVNVEVLPRSSSRASIGANRNHSAMPNGCVVSMSIRAEVLETSHVSLVSRMQQSCSGCDGTASRVDLYLRHGPSSIGDPKANRILCLVGAEKLAPVGRAGTHPSAKRSTRQLSGGGRRRKPGHETGESAADAVVSRRHESQPFTTSSRFRSSHNEQILTTS